MQPIRYSINLTLDGRCDHTAMEGSEEMHQRAAATIARADALLFGRVTYQMMEEAFRSPPDSAGPFARSIDRAKKYVVSRSLERVDWNAELLRGDDLEKEVRALKSKPGRGLYVGGVTLPLALAELGLIDEYEFTVHPRIAGNGRPLFAGLSKPLDLTLVSRTEYTSGAVAMRYTPRR